MKGSMTWQDAVVGLIAALAAVGVLRALLGRAVREGAATYFLRRGRVGLAMKLRFGTGGASFARGARTRTKGHRCN